MPAVGRSNKPARVETLQDRRRRRSQRHTRRPPTTTALQNARAQERLYASQGRSVERQANRQRARTQPRAGGDDKGAHEFARGQAYVRSLYQRKYGDDWRRFYEPGTTQPPLTAARRRLRQATARSDPKRRAAVSAPALTILEQLTRPIHALAATERQAIREFKEGNFTPGDLGDLASAFGRGISNREKSLTSDVLGDLGFPEGKVRSALGFVGDVFGDPTTYISGGTTVVARKSAEAAARKATEAALKKGLSKKAADRAGRAAAREAIEKAPKNRGITIGFAGRQSSGKASARAIEKLGISKGAEKARGSLPGRLVRHVAPRMRPAGVSAADWERVRAAVVRGRAATATGEHRARNVAQAIARALPGDNHQRVIDALEERSVRGLTEQEERVARALAKEFDDIYRAESSRGLVGRKLMTDFGYFPRRPVSELERGGSKKRLAGAQLASSKTRTNRKRYAEFRGTEDDIYTQNAAVATYLRARDSAVRIGRKVVIDELHAVGRRFHPGAKINAGESVYKFTANGRKMPVRVDDDELKSLMRGGAPAGQNEYRILHDDLVREADPSPAKLERLEEIGALWDRALQGRVKTILTVPNPQYHLANMYGDLWKAYTEHPAASLLRDLGISARALKWKAKREAASKTLGKAVDPANKGIRVDGRKMPWDQLVKEAEDHGAISQGFIARDLADVLDAQGKEAAERMGRGKIARRTRATQRVAASRVGSRVLHPLDTIRDVSQYREDWVRLALYAGRRRKGDAPNAAADFANRTLIDYGDLTTFERSVLRRVMPFYTFTARNLPQQTSALIRRPGKFANLEKARENAMAESGLPEDWQEQIREFEQRGIPMPIPDGSGRMLFPKLPAMDLNRLTPYDQGEYLAAMLSPLIKVPLLELPQNYSFFFREHIDPLLEETGPNGEKVRTLRPAPKWFVDVLNRLPQGKGLVDALHIRKYRDKNSGKVVWGWPAKMDYLMKQTPASSVGFGFGSELPNSRGQTPEQRLFGWLTGLKVAPFEPKQIKERNLGEEYGFLQAKARAMRDQGDAYDAEGNRTSAYQKVLDRTREVGRALGVYDKRKKPSMLSPEAQEALKSLSGSGGPQLSPEAKAALDSLKP